MKKIAAAIGVSAVLGMGANMVQAESLLFPYYTVGNGKYSFLALVNTDAAAGGTFAAPIGNVHWVWNYKTGASATDACKHHDQYGYMSQNDMIHQPVNAPNAVLAGGTGIDIQAMVGDRSVARYLPFSDATGFMVVSNQTAAGAASAEDSLYGQMIVIDTTAGLVGAYKGMNNPISTAEGNFNNAMTSKPNLLMSWYPTAETGSRLGAAGVATSWVVMPTGQNMHNQDWNQAVNLRNTVGFVWDRDETPYSGYQNKVVRCLGTVARSDIVDAAAMPYTRDGGFAVMNAQLGVINKATNSFEAIALLGGAATDGQVRDANGVHAMKVEISAAMRAATVSNEHGLTNLPY